MKQLIFVMIVFFAQGVFAQNEEQRAIKQYELGMYEQASVSLEDYLRDGEMDKLLYIMLADCYGKMNQPERAIALFERMDSKFELRQEEYLMWGLNLKKMAMYEAAASVFERMAQQNPELSEEMVANCKVGDLLEKQTALNIRQAPFNTPHSDFGPALYKGSLVYCSARSDLVRPRQVSMESRNAFQNQLYKLRKPGSSPVFLQSDLKDVYNNGPLCYADRAGMVAYVKNNYMDGHTQINPVNNSASIYLAEVDASGDWSKSTPFTHNSVHFSNSFPWLSEDGNTLYFASNREGGYGGYDLYLSQKGDDGLWTTPKNLGSSVNTEGNEVAPFLLGEDLYFSSDRHRGLGGMDVFRLRTTDQATVLENLGAGINSPRDDYGFVTDPSGKKGFLVSNRAGGSGNEDIYTFKMDPAAIAAVVAKKEHRYTEKDMVLQTDGIVEQDPKATTILMADGASWKEAHENGGIEDPAERKTIFTIQVAAFRDQGGGYEEIARKLDDIGRVYKVYFANMIKVRVGNFEKEQQARQALEKVRQRGYKDAFLVTEEMVIKTAKDQKMLHQEDSTPDVVPGEPEPEDAAENSEQYESVENQEQPDYELDPDRLKDMPVYRVRIASYTESSWFDDSKIRHLGKIVTEEKGEWTIYYLGDYRTIEDAEAVRTEVKKAGFNAAQLYMERDGELIKVR